MYDVFIYDTTLRDGTRGEGFKLSVPEKLAFVEVLDDLGVAYIEGGEPGLQPRDRTFFNEVRNLRPRFTRLAAHGPVADAEPERDAVLSALLHAEPPVVTLTGCAWRSQLDRPPARSPEAHLLRIEQSVRFIRSHTDEVMFDAEHFFDGYVEDPDYAMRTIQAAIVGGADYVVLCDTNGGMLGHHLAGILERVVAASDRPVGVRAHNDAELGVANSIAAVKAGATVVKGTINGYGQRCGSANLTSIIPALELKMGLRCLPEGHIRLLTRVARTIDELTNHVPWTSQPYVGRTAFVRRGNAHVTAEINPSDEHVQPQAIGNQRRILVSDPDGRANVMAKLSEYGLYLSPDDPRTRDLVNRVRALESQGWQFEGAEASFKLLVNEALGRRKQYFSLIDLEVNVSIAGAQSHLMMAPGLAQARIQLQVGEETAQAQAQGNGPIHALDAAIRKILHGFYPSIRSVRLVDYKVRILSSGVGTESMCRVLVQWGDGDEVWGTVGVSTNIIQASWRALVDALEYKLHKDGVEPLGSKTARPPFRQP